MLLLLTQSNNPHRALPQVDPVQQVLSTRSNPNPKPVQQVLSTRSNPNPHPNPNPQSFTTGWPCPTSSLHAQ